MNLKFLIISFLLAAFTSCSLVKKTDTAVNKLAGIQAADTIPKLPPSTVVTSRVIAVSTAFTVPIIRFNRNVNQDSSSDHSKGSVALFNSIGAGININFGELTEHTDADSKVTSSGMDNAYGIQLGFLFAANTEDGNRQDVFAFTAGVSVLNFQFGYGYEFGHVVANQRRGFFTLAYSVPVSKLVHGGFFVLKSSHKAHPKPYFPN